VLSGCVVESTCSLGSANVWGPQSPSTVTELLMRSGTTFAIGALDFAVGTVRCTPFVDSAALSITTLLMGNAATLRLNRTSLAASVADVSGAITGFSTQTLNVVLTFGQCLSASNLSLTSSGPLFLSGIYLNIGLDCRVLLGSTVTVAEAMDLTGSGTLIPSDGTTLRRSTGVTDVRTFGTLRRPLCCPAAPPASPPCEQPFVSSVRLTAPPAVLCCAVPGCAVRCAMLLCRVQSAPPQVRL
jgi:hypothetical protein